MKANGLRRMLGKRWEGGREEGKGNRRKVDSTIDRKRQKKTEREGRQGKGREKRKRRMKRV